ncbi:RE1 [Symbiodinium microadriaticum]|nr:RE1 [Symbiodinium microadriaticum]
MRGPRHIRQKYQNSNALCLSLDLIGPWIKGRDHVLSGPARFILVATLGVPLLRDGQPLPLSDEAKKEKEERSEEKEKEERSEEREEGQRWESEGCQAGHDKADDDEADDGGGIGEWVLEDEAEGGRDEPDCDDMSDDEYRRLCDEHDEKWKEVAKGLKEPVELHELVFAEPLTSKKASEVLRGVQRIYAKIRLLNLEVRRTHSDGGPVPDGHGGEDRVYTVEKSEEVAEEMMRGYRNLAVLARLKFQKFILKLGEPNLRRDELSNVFDVHQAMKRSSNEEIQALRDSGAQIEILPAKALFHLKGGTGRHKCRVVACGNFSENAKAKGRERKLQCYAGGADSLSLRCHLRVAGHRAVTHGWRTSLADIRTAFLLAPLREKTKRTFLRPPSVLRQAGFAAEGEFWEITGALYGMQESPADWASYRDETLPTIGIWIQGKKIFLERSAYDNNMWLLRCPETSGLLAVLSIYVDDLLLSGTPEASEAVWAAIKEKWRISEPEYADLGRAITFCGFEIRQEADGIHVGQAKYVQSLLDKYPEIQGTTTCPYAKESEGIETKPSPSLQNIRRAQALVGEILWLATRTRADLVYGVSRIGQLITRDCDQAIQRGEDMIRYLRATKNQELLYGCPGKGHGPGDQLPVERSFNLIEVFADASFCPGSDRSQSGIILMWGNAPIGWMSMRQACASLSTAEAELQASLDGMTLAEGIVENSTFEIEGDAGNGDNSLDGASGGAEPLSGGEGDEVEDLGAEFQTALQPKLAEPQNPVIYPGWPLRLPPWFSWDPEPEWGGPESNFHQRMPARLQQDLWYVDHRRGLISRFHVKPRVKLFLPGPSGWPDGISQDRLTGRRRTLAMLHNPEGQQILEDDWSRTSRPTRLLKRKWTGRTEFELRCDS